MRSPNERYARNALAMFTGLGIYATWGLVLVERPRATTFIAIAAVLALSWGFRRRSLRDWQRRSETMEDERDHAVRAAGDHGFRIAMSFWTVGLAFVVALWSSQAPVLSGERLSGLLLLGVIVANLAGHAVVVWRYRQQRP